MNLKKLLFITLLLFWGFQSPLFAQNNSTQKGALSAQFFGDYYWFAAHHNNDTEGNNGFWIRRVYLTYDHKISDSFSGRIRLEMQSEGDFATNSALKPEIKDAWLKYEFNDQHELIAGIAPTPTWELVEEVWGYRPVAKTPLDLQDVGSSRGLGISLSGKIGRTKRLGYSFMFTNGNGSKTELNQGKKFMLAVSYELTDHLVVQAYGDYESTEENNYNYTLQGFIGYKSEALNFGALYAYHWRESISSELTIASLFANFDITPKVRGYLRVDHTFEPNPFGAEIEYYIFSDEAQLTYLTGGVDIQLHSQISLLPNIQTVFYGENEAGLSPDNDIMARLTLAFKLK